MRFQMESLAAFCVAVLVRSGVNPEHSRLTAETLVTTDAWGIYTHGTKNLRGYIRRIKGGGIKADATPRVDRQGPAWAAVDGDGALGMVGSHFAMSKAIEKARHAGVGYVGLRNSCHFGAAGFYAFQAADEGLIGIAMSNDTPTVSVPGSSGPVLGSNPFAYAIPMRGQPPILLDIATSTVAGGKVFRAAIEGKGIPEGWIIDSNGRPTTDPKLFPDNASLTPFAGHKGYGIAFLIETLSSVLTGASIASQVLSWSFGDASLPTNHGAAFIALDIETIMPRDEFYQRLADTVAEIRNAPRAEGINRIYLPGEKEWANREEAIHNGIPLPFDVVESLKALGDEVGIPLSTFFEGMDRAGVIA